MPTKTKKSEPIIVEPEVQMMEEPKDPEDYITFKRSTFYSVLVALSFAVGILVGYVAWGRNTATTAAANPQNAAAPSAGNVVEAPTAQPQYVRYKVPTDGFPSRGPADAKITIVEFSDFQCPFCRRFESDTYQALMNAYPNQIRFVYRNLPLTSIHPNAMPAAIASLCAKDQNVYWDFHDKLFANETLDQPTYIQYAKDLGIDVDKFTTCLTDGSHDAEIKQDMDFSLGLGVQSTPTFFVNGLAIVGAQPLSSFTQLIDKELAGTIPQ